MQMDLFADTGTYELPMTNDRIWRLCAGQPEHEQAPTDDDPPRARLPE